MRKKTPQETLAANRFVVVVGRDHLDGDTAAAEKRLRKKLHDAVVAYLRRTGVKQRLAMATADRVVADRLGTPGETVIYLTAEQVGIYLHRTRLDILT